MTFSPIKTATLSAILSMLSACAVGPTAPADAQGTLEGRRNVILFLGDGMGVSTVTAARIFAGQQAGKPGEEHALSFEQFPNLALIKTYNVDAQVADSAGTMSAIMTGEKTRIGHISVAASVPQGDCKASLRGEQPTLLEQAEDAGYATGVVSTARITHATPAATFAHVPDRGWESDAQLPEAAAAAGCRDIARQLIEFDHGDGIELVLGGGRAMFLPSGVKDPEYPSTTGYRADGRNLAEEWQQQRDARYVWSREAFDALSPNDPAPVLGLFEPSHMQFEADRENDAAGEPSLAEMTAFAIDKLSAANPDGYFLMVEGGRIDHAHHGANAYRALADTVALAEAVEAAMARTNHAETLILVTADHSHTFTISGYPRRGNPILGKVEIAPGELATDTEGRPYTTLGYQNGPGYRESIPDLTDVDTGSPDYRQLGAYPMESETHGGEDVAAYATGPSAQWVHGVMEQNQLYNVMRRVLLPGDEPARGR